MAQHVRMHVDVEARGRRPALDAPLDLARRRGACRAARRRARFSPGRAQRARARQPRARAPRARARPRARCASSIPCRARALRRSAASMASEVEPGELGNAQPARVGELEERRSRSPGRRVVLDRHQAHRVVGREHLGQVLRRRAARARRCRDWRATSPCAREPVEEPAPAESMRASERGDEPVAVQRGDEAADVVRVASASSARSPASAAPAGGQVARVGAERVARRGAARCAGARGSARAALAGVLTDGGHEAPRAHGSPARRCARGRACPSRDRSASGPRRRAPPRRR